MLSNIIFRHPIRCLRALVTVLVLTGLIISYVLVLNSQRFQSSNYASKQYTFPKFLSPETQCAAMKISLEEGQIDLKTGKSRYDNKRMLRIYDFHFTGKEWDSLIHKYDVCFATQTSVERIYWLPYILEKWSGPLSIAAHLTGDAEWLVLNLFMCYLSHCHASYRNQVALHLAVPSSIQRAFTVRDEMLRQWNVTELGEIYEKGQSCPDAKDYLKYLLKTFPTVDKESLKLKEVYPQNHMRNIARKACGTPWTYSADVDIIPRDGMADMLQEFYESMRNTSCEKCAFVIPTFEVNETSAFPNTKQDVVNLFKEGIPRQFHGKLYSPGHKATDYPKWTSTNLDDDKVQISHKILNNTEFYEPFYVSPDTIPSFDERFLGYGFTRNSQFKAARMAGWNFTVLTPVFSVHLGLQTNKTVLSPKKDGVGKNVRREQTSANYRLYKKIEQELELKRKLGLL